jgi:hypothetical protein
MKQPLTFAAAALLLAACSDNPVAPPREAPAPSFKAALSTGASSTALDFTDLSNDLVSRLLPSFDDAEAARVVETSIRELNAYALAGEIAAARSSSQTIRTALKAGVASAALLDAMHRTLDVVDRELGAASTNGGSLTIAP